MAIDGINSVNNKRGSAGQAYVLPTNQAIGVYANGIANQQEKKRLLEAAALKRQQEISDGNYKEIGGLKLGDHWGERTGELQKDYNALIEYALEATRKGQNINSDKQFLQMKNSVLSKAAATKDLQGLFDKTKALVGSNPDAFENGVESLQEIRGASLDDFISGKFKPQELRKIYTMADAIKDSGGTISYVKNNDGTYDTTKVNRSGNVGQAISSLDSQSAKYIVKKAGGDTGAYISGFPTLTKDGKAYYNTSGKDFEDAVIGKLATDVNFIPYLQSKGYDVSSNELIKKSAFDFAKKQNEATGTYVKGYADVLEGKATTDKTRTFAAEQNQRAKAGEARAIETHANNKKKWAQEDLDAAPDSILPNVVTNISGQGYTVDGNGAKTVKNNIRQSTSLAATNVGNSKSPFLPQTVYNQETGVAEKNATSRNISGGQIHIKPVLKMNGGSRILDDESLAKLRAGTYKLNGKIVPKNTPIQYDELLYGDEALDANPLDPAAKKSQKIIIPITGQSLDGKFTKAYNREEMWDISAKNAMSKEDKIGLATQIVLTKAKKMGYTYTQDEIDENVARYLNSIK